MSRVAIDVGGTFTDCLVLDQQGRLREFKALTTPQDPSRGLMECLEKAARAEQKSLPEFARTLEYIIHGTTLATNALLTGRGAKIAMLTTDILKKKLMPVLITIEPGGSTHKEEAKVGTEKFLYVLDGTLEAKVGEAVHELRRGSSLYLDASIPHSLRNTGKGTAKCLSVVTPPVL